ncbi:uncharacterized protein LOC135077240 [Ostrinia nubilalis]|uniref:uncharacterized protein LOC135077240 n=1 Tax=Ostrinia nubilalis TaxID=29057 RepID=UPI0030826975
MQTAERSTYPVYNEATPNITQSIDYQTFRNKKKSSHVSTNKANVRHTCTREGTDKSQLPIEVFSSAKSRRFIPSHFQFETVKQICQIEKVSSVQSFSRAKFLTERRLDGEGGSQPSVLSSTYSRAASKVPETDLQRRAAPDDLPSVWPVIGTENVHFPDELDRRISEESQYQVCGLFGRFLAGQSVSPYFTRPRRFYGEPDATTRMDDQRGQICTGSDSTPGVSGSYMGHQTQHEVPVGTEAPNATHGPSKSDVQGQLVSPTSPVTSGETQLCLIRRTQRATTLSDYAVLQPTASQSAPLQASKYTRTCSYRDELVDGSRTGLVSDTYSPDITPADHGRVRLRLGSSTGRCEHVRSVDKTTTHMACQPQRALCGFRGDTTERVATECSHIVTNGQPYGSGVRQQGRRNQIEETVRPHSATVDSNGPAQYSSDGTVLPGQIQLRSGRIIPGPGLPGVEFDRGSHECNIPDVGNAGSGLVRIEDGSRGSEVRNNGHAGRRSNFSQRLPAAVGLRPGVAVPSAEFDSPSTVVSQHGERSVCFDHPEVEQGLLESGPSSPRHSGTIPHTEPGTSTHRHENRDASAPDPRNMFGGMAGIGWFDEIKGWSQEETSLLMSSWRKSTLNTYRPAWNKWKTWCGANSISYTSPSPEQVARYLAHLHNDEGLAYRTILVHKSVIATFTNTNLSSNFFVKHILKAVSVAKEKKTKPPIWNVKELLKCLENSAPDSSNLYQVSRRAAILLLLASGRRVHDLTLLIIDPESCVDEGDSILLWPKFGSKTDSCSYRQSGWKLKKHPNQNLDCVHWIRQLIAISQDRRRQGNIKELFITARGDPKPASRTVLGGWIKSVLRDAGVEAPPGSVRSAVASLNWIEHFPVDQILATGNWRQEHTFRTYYQKEIINQASDTDLSHSVSLSNFFEPVQ